MIYYLSPWTLRETYRGVSQGNAGHDVFKTPTTRVGWGGPIKDFLMALDGSFRD